MTVIETKKEGQSGYSRIAKLLHWLTAAFILVLIPVGFVMTDLPDGETRNSLYEYHKSFGMLVWVIAALRVAYRLVHGAPPPDPALTPFQRRASHAVHLLLYGLVIALPILGYIGVSMCCSPVNFLMMWPVPIHFSGSEATVKLILSLHGLGAIILAILVIAHIGAALYHSLVKGDGVLSRMI